MGRCGCFDGIPLSQASAHLPQTRPRLFLDLPQTTAHPRCRLEPLQGSDEDQSAQSWIGQPPSDVSLPLSLSLSLYFFVLFLSLPLSLYVCIYRNMSLYMLSICIHIHMHMHTHTLPFLGVSSKKPRLFQVGLSTSPRRPTTGVCSSASDDSTGRGLLLAKHFQRPTPAVFLEVWQGWSP